MKELKKPEIEIVVLSNNDILTTSDEYGTPFIEF